MSRIRQVTDHREVPKTKLCHNNHHNNNNDSRGSCFMIELLDLDTINASDDESCIKRYFTDLSEDNNTVSEHTIRIDLIEKLM